MAFSPGSPVTGLTTIPGGYLTSPTFSLSLAQTPNQLEKAYIVSSLGGTQTGVESHTGSNPFMIVAQVPAVFRGQSIGQNGVGAVNTGYNVFRTTFRKGLVVDPAGNRRIGTIRTEYIMPPGWEIYDPESGASMLSFSGAAVRDLAPSWFDTLRQGNL